MPSTSENVFIVGEHVAKVSGDYRFEGVAVAAFTKISGARRYVVENGDGVLHIFSPAQLALMAQGDFPHATVAGSEHNHSRTERTDRPEPSR
jgi:hypothetical protein